jgi:GDPmannose 4,6-dehydratase
LLAKGYVVQGLVRTPRSLARGNLAALVADESLLGTRLHLHVGTCEDTANLRRVISLARPDELYHLAAQSSPQLSLEIPVSTVDCIGVATMHLLEIVRDLPIPPRLLYASSAEIFGLPTESPQHERTPINPTTPYGAAKAFALQMVRIYRDTHRLPVSSLILYNHESPRRDEMFFTRKVTRAAARIKLGLQKELALGSLQGRRDWGYAKEYVELMWRTLQRDHPDEYVVATGVTHSVQDLVEASFGRLGLDWRDHVRHDPRQVRAHDSQLIVGDPAKARRELGWNPQVGFRELVGIMTDADFERARLEAGAGAGGAA